jgi:hypothetical protein
MLFVCLCSEKHVAGSNFLLGKQTGKEGLEKNVNIATKFAAYPWRLMPSQIVSACKYVMHSCFSLVYS